MEFKRPLLVLAAAIAVNFTGIWIMPLIDRDEAYYAQVAREMGERRDFVVPHFNGEPWPHKPPLLFWCQSAAFRVFGESEFAARLPSAIASAMCSLVLFGFASRLCGGATGFRAAMMFTLSAVMLYVGKAAMTDGLLCLFTTIAFWSGWEIVNCCRGDSARRTGAWWWIFYASLCAVFLTKGPVCIFPPAALLLYGWWSGTGLRGVCLAMKFGRGMALVALAGAAWFVPVHIATGGSFTADFLEHRILLPVFIADFDHGATNLLSYLAMLPLHFLVLLPAFFPWSLWIVRATRRLIANRSAGEIYALSGSAVVFAVFSIANTKLPLYPLPAYPLLACLVAPSVPLVSVRAFGIAMFAANIAFAFIAPFLAGYSPTMQISRALPLPPRVQMAATYGFEPSLVWYLGGAKENGPIRSLDAAEVGAFLSGEGPRLCVLNRGQEQAVDVRPEWKRAEAEGFNIAKGRWQGLVILVKE